MPNIKLVALIVSEIWPKQFLPCRWHHLWGWHRLMFKLEHYITYALVSNCANYQLSGFISLWDIIKTNFGNVDGTTGGVCSTWFPGRSTSLPMIWGVTLANIMSFALLVSEIQSK